MVQLECPRVMHPLVSFTIVDYCKVSFSLHAGKGKWCILLAKKVGIYFVKIGFVDSKWAYLNASGSNTPWCHSLFGYNEECPFFHWMQEKGNAACGLLIKWKFILQK